MPKLETENLTPFYEDELFRLVGAIPELDILYNNKVKVYVNDTTVNKWTIYVKQKETIILNRDIFKDFSCLENCSFDLPKNHQKLGLGTKVFVTQVREAMKHKIPLIKTYATNPFVWGRLGYDIKFSNEEKRKLKKAGFVVESLNELMSTPIGVSYWRHHCWNADMFFDTSENSSSINLLRSYLKDKVARELKFL